MFALDLVIIQKFSIVQVSPPVKLEDLDPKISELEAKGKWYEDNGKEKLQEQIQEIKNQAAR